MNCIHFSYDIDVQSVSVKPVIETTGDSKVIKKIFKRWLKFSPLVERYDRVDSLTNLHNSPLVQDSIHFPNSICIVWQIYTKLANDAPKGYLHIYIPKLFFFLFEKG